MNNDEGDIIKELVDMQFDEVSLVDRGANQHAKVLLSKRDESVEEQEVDKANPTSHGLTTQQPLDSREEDDEDKKKVKVVVEDESVDKSQSKRTFADAARELVEKMGFQPQKPSALNQQPQPPYPSPQPNPAAPIAGMQAPAQSLPPAQPQPAPQPAPQPQMMPQQAMAPQMPGMAPAAPPPGIQPGASSPPLPQEVIDYIKALEEQVLEQEQGNQPQSQEESGSMGFAKSDDTTEFLEALAKNLEDANNAETSEAISKAIELVEKANERAERAEAIAKMEQQVRLEREFVSKAQQFQHLSVSPEEFGPVLKAVYENLDEEQVQTLEKALTGLDDKMTGLFNEVGKSISYGAEEHISKAESEAKKLSESDSGLTPEQALAKAYTSNPDLYDEYLNEG